MGFAQGFQAGSSIGGNRSNMPLVQGMGSMIDRLANRNKQGSIRFGGPSGPSSYDKYVARKDKEAAAAEEQRRFEISQEAQKQREQEQTDLNERKMAEQAETNAQNRALTAEKIAQVQEQRAQARKIVERSEKKEKRIEAYRAFLQGMASGNKALAEESWAALTPDIAEDDENAGGWAEIKNEPLIDPETGQPQVDPQTGKPIRKFTVGRDEKGGEGKNAMPAPSVDFNEDGSVTVDYPVPGADQREPVTYASVDEFMNQTGNFMNPELEVGGKAKKDTEGRAVRREERQIKNDEIKEARAAMKQAEADLNNAAIDEDEYNQIMAENKQILKDVKAQGKGKKVKTKEIGGVQVYADPDKRPPAVRGGKNVRFDKKQGVWIADDKNGDPFYVAYK